jgi:peptidoglycan/LPS O-acetylase OafA/YrhL
MPEPVRGDQKYLPGLDGLRAIAVAAVIAYHLGYGWAQGGLLGVAVFFTLSGYLITDILVGQWAARGRIKLGDFWLRRARRLLPALFVMLAVVTLWVNLGARSFLPGFRGNVIASLGYVSNWWYIDQHASYYARFAPPAPLDHLWSLAVEEQFYLVWPWVVLLLVWLAGRAQRRRRNHLEDELGGLAGPVQGSGGPYLTGWSRVALAVVTLTLAAGSAVLMTRLYHPGYDPTRPYEGTDTRAFGLLIGAAVALVWPTRRPATPAASGGTGTGGTGTDWKVPALARRLLDLAGLAGLVVIGLLVWRTNQYSDFMFRGGLVVLSVATAATVAAVATPGSLLGRPLGWLPLRWLGVRSYGIYLWHYPIIVLTVAAGAAGGPVSPVRAVVLVAATVAAAAVSWRFIESPIRRGARLRWVAVERSQGEAGGNARRRRPVPRRSPQAIGGLCVLGVALIAAGVTASMRLTSATGHPAAPGADSQAMANAQLSNTGPTPEVAPGGAPARAVTAKPGAAASGNAASAGPTATAAGPTATAGGSTATAPGLAATAAGPAATVPALPTPPPRTSCTSVVHIGDSTSEGLVSPNYEPNPANRIPARYADVGVKKSIMKIVGATSVVESLPGTPNASDMASQVKRGGFRGCWVLALGTNDTADVYAGSNVSRVQRIEKMMSLIGNQPVMWVEVTSLLSSGPYAEQNMQLWNRALQQVQAHYPNMKIYNWPAIAQKSWFISDGIHYTTIGYAHRAVAIADALAAAFPAS